jgi:tyrosyl-tRNA synthetase
MIMTLAQELAWRGQIKDKTFDDITWLNSPRIFYLGTDASADSLTIGNLAIYMMARRLRKHGWKAVLLVGGATSLIGDPGGKEEERELKSREEIKANVAKVKAQVQQLFADMDFNTVDNYDWFKDLGYLDFLRDVGKHYSMTELLQRDFVTARIGETGSGISYAEFSYSLIQGYDYWYLYKNHGVELQIGGSDQWGNMLSGVPLVRKKEGAEVHALSMPLVIDKLTGKKFGKSEEGAIWLDPDKTSVYKFYQFWLNTDDQSVEEYLKVFTELEPEEIERIMTEFNTDRATRLAQKTLAYEVSQLVHGRERADSVKRVSEVLFGQVPYSELSENDLSQLKEELPYAEGKLPFELVEAMTGAGLAGSNSEARRFLAEKAVYVNGQQLVDKAKIEKNDLLHGYAVLRRGKNSIALIKAK